MDEIERKLDRILKELRVPTAIGYSVRRGQSSKAGLNKAANICLERASRARLNRPSGMSIYDEYRIVINEAQRRLIMRTLTNAMANLPARAAITIIGCLIVVLAALWLFIVTKTMIAFGVGALALLIAGTCAYAYRHGLKPM